MIDSETQAVAASRVKDPALLPSSSSSNNSTKQSAFGFDPEASLLQQLRENPFFTAGFGLAGLGALAAVAQRSVRHAATLLKRRLLVDVEINNKDDSYEWFLRWMTAQQRSQLAQATAQKRNLEHTHSTIFDRFLRRLTPGLRHLAIETERLQLPNGTTQTHFALVPGPGKHLLRYRRAFVLVERMRETKSMDFQRGRPWETVTLTTLYAHRGLLQDIFLEAHQLAQKAIHGKTLLYHPVSTGWEPFGEPRRKRSLESVVLDQGVAEHVEHDLKDFIASAQWYFDRGIPYRRGYLLHGPPGSGKTSFIQALAGELDYNIAMLNLSERGLTDDRLQHLLTVVPKRTLVLLEDADAAFGNRRVQSDSDGYRGANVTFSGLLNALDGVGSAEERILFLTTNHVERMDPALIRPGRVDLSVHLGDATQWQVERFWRRFYGDQDPDFVTGQRFNRRLQELHILPSFGSTETSSRYPISTAALQGLFLYNKGDMDGAIGMAVGLLPAEARRDARGGEVASAAAATS